MTSSELVIRDLICDAAEIGYIKSVVTAYDGLCGLFSTGGQNVSLVAPKGREAELDLLVDDLVEELKLRRIAQELSQKLR